MAMTRAARTRVGSPTPKADAASVIASLEPGAVVIADRRVLGLHPPLAKALRARADIVVHAVTAGERLKSLSGLAQLAKATLPLRRHGLLCAIGGGTVGDLATVGAHLIKRGVRLWHVPSTLLAAVDSSIGGKGALNVGAVKNALGVFHEPERTFVLPELFTTLTPTQRREGRVEAWKMALTLDALTYRRWCAAAPDDEPLVVHARALKTAICRADPLESKGLRVVLNFGHTFGHVFEALSGFRVRHGDAVGLGMLCALDVGVALGVTPAQVRDAVTPTLPLGAAPRVRLSRLLSRATDVHVAALLSADKKADAAGLRMVLLERPGRWRAVPVAEAVWRACARRWRRGEAP